MPTRLQDLINRFELPFPDAGFPDLIAVLVDAASERVAMPVVPADVNAKYFYLLARTYELVGYSARHTPWLSNSQRFYWHKALSFIEEAMLLVPADSALNSFLHGKLLFRDAMITLDGKTADPTDKGPDLLEQAEARFGAAARREEDVRLQHIYADAASIARTERQLRTYRKELQVRIARAKRKPLPAAIDAIVKHLDAFPAPPWAFPSAAAGMSWPVQHALADVRPLCAMAQMHEEVVKLISEVRKKLDDGGSETLARCEKVIADSYEQSAIICDDVGLVVRAADNRVTLQSRLAEASLRHCTREFRLAQERDNDERTRLLARAGVQPRLLPDDAAAALREIPTEQDWSRVPPKFIKAAATIGVRLDVQATVFPEGAASWIIRSGADRFLVRATDGPGEIIDLDKQPIAFSDNEAETFNAYSSSVHETCELYTTAIREILRLLESATDWYEKMAGHLKSGAAKAPNDAHLVSLDVTIRSILKELRARNYPLLATLRVRTRYAWSLLEMFQMRNQSVRLGTLFSGRCQLLMANPFFDPDKDVVEDQLLEVGADPIFQTTVDFVFRGAKGEENRHDFQRKALHTTTITIDQQELSLVVESRYLDLYPETRRSLIARLACHRSLARALELFTDIYVAQRANQLPTATIRRSLKGIADHFGEADSALIGSGDYRSKLIDATGLDALHDYMQGIAQVLIGMNERAGKRAWEGIYRGALDLLQSGRRKLAEVGDVYLLPKGDVRAEYLDYVDARILTVSGFKSRYHGEEASNPADYKTAADLFDKAAEIFERRHDYRVATKARARAADARTFAAATAQERYRWLKEANALYAACADPDGYKDTSDRLQEFSDEELGVSRDERTQRSAVASVPPPAPVAAKGRTKFASWEIEYVTSGGMADVYRATGDDGGVVALKRLKEKHLSNQKYRERFMREFETAKVLQHDNVVRVFVQGEWNGFPYFTMEFLTGRTLEIPVAAHQILPPAEVVDIMSQVAEALAHAHRRGIVHRDLKPSNVMLLDANGLKIMDFGAAQDQRYSFSPLTEEGFVLGSPLYASPEQLRTGKATSVSDLYSLGLICYELLTGKTALEPLQRLGQTHPRPSSVIDDIPEAIDAIVARLIQREPGDRYPSAEALIAELDSLMMA